MLKNKETLTWIKIKNEKNKPTSDLMHEIGVEREM
jgi:hypothetical protein